MKARSAVTDYSGASMPDRAVMPRQLKPSPRMLRWWRTACRPARIICDSPSSFLSRRAQPALPLGWGRPVAPGTRSRAESGAGHGRDRAGAFAASVVQAQRLMAPGAASAIRGGAEWAGIIVGTFGLNHALRRTGAIMGETVSFVFYRRSWQHLERGNCSEDTALLFIALRSIQRAPRSRVSSGRFLLGSRGGLGGGLPGQTGQQAGSCQSTGWLIAS
jgi:hypothetical protein